LLGDPESQQDIIANSDRFVEEFAKEGLRTLYLGNKTILQEDYDDWNVKFEKA